MSDKKDKAIKESPIMSLALIINSANRLYSDKWECDECHAKFNEEDMLASDGMEDGCPHCGGEINFKKKGS